MAIDFDGVHGAAVGHLMRAVNDAIAEEPGHSFYAAAVYSFGMDTDSINWPVVSVSSQDSIVATAKSTGYDPEDLWWSPSDWRWHTEANDSELWWAEHLSSHSTNEDFEQRQEVLDSFKQVFARACISARGNLIATGTVDDSFLVVPLDDASELLDVVLTEDEMTSNFGDLFSSSADNTETF